MTLNLYNKNIKKILKNYSNLFFVVVNFKYIVRAYV